MRRTPCGGRVCTSARMCPRRSRRPSAAPPALQALVYQAVSQQLIALSSLIASRLAAHREAVPPRSLHQPPPGKRRCPASRWRQRGWKRPFDFPILRDRRWCAILRGRRLTCGGSMDPKALPESGALCATSTSARHLSVRRGLMAEAVRVLKATGVRQGKDGGLMEALWTRLRRPG